MRMSNKYEAKAQIGDIANAMGAIGIKRESLSLKLLQETKVSDNSFTTIIGYTWLFLGSPHL